MLPELTAELDPPVTAICETVNVLPSASVSSATNKLSPELWVTVASSLTLSVSFTPTGGFPLLTVIVNVPVSVPPLPSDTI